MGLEGSEEHVLSSLEALGRQAVVDVLGRQHCDSAVVVVFVVPGEEVSAVHPGVLD